MSVDPEQKEAEELQYSLRSTFFYRRHREFKELLAKICEIDSDKYDWSPSESLGISQTSLSHIKNKSIPYCQIFCHPEVISTSPQLIAYY